MAKHKTRTIIACAAGTMFALGIGCLSLRITEWSATHHAELTIATIVGFGGAVIGAISWLLTKEDSAVASIPSALQLNMRAERDIVRSPQIGTVHGDVHFGNQNPVSAIPATPSIQRLPILELGFAIATAQIDDTYPRFGGDGSRAIVVRVRNKPGSLGEVTPHARDIFAQLDFDCAIGRSTVERAYWVDRDCNQITLTGGDEAWVLVGIAEHSFLSSWHNANTYSSSTREWDSPTLEPESRTIPWGAGELSGQIYIISHSPKGNITLAHKRFIFTRENWTNDFGKINLKFVE